MEVPSEPLDVPDEWGASDEEVDGVISSGCSLVGDISDRATAGDSFLPMETQVSVIPGTDAEMLQILNDTSLECSGALRKRKFQDTGSPASAFSHTYAGFRDPDFFSSSAYTPKPLVSSGPEPSSALSASSLKSVDGTALVVNQSPVIIVEPIADSRPVSKFLANDVAIARSVQLSPFHPFLIDTRKNYSKNLLVLTLNASASDMDQLLLVKSLGDWTVSCRLPQMLHSSRGLMGPVGLDSDLAELKGMLSDAYPDISNVIRLCKGKDKIPTLSVIVTFTSPSLPEHVTFCHQRFRIRPFIDKPWQCFRCQGFGHNAEQCRSKPRCVVCGENHMVRDCPSRVNSQGRLESQLHCANCQGNHTANYGGCKFMKQAQRVEEVRTRQRVSYRDAVATVRASTRYSHSSAFSGLPHSVPVPSVQPSSSQQLSVQPSVSVGCQTDPLEVQVPAQESQVAISLINDSSFIQSLISMVLKVLLRTGVIPTEKSDAVQLLLRSDLSVDDQAALSVSSPLVSSALNTSVPHDKLLTRQHKDQSTTSISSPRRVSQSGTSYDSHPCNAAKVDSPTGTKAKRQRLKRK